MKQFFCLLILVVTSFSAWAQISVSPDGSDVQEIIENNAQQSETESFDYDAFIDELEMFKKNPIAINKATAEQLTDLPILNAQQIASLLNYIELHGKLISIYELQAVPGFDIKTIQLMLPYVKVEQSISETKVPIGKLLSKGRWILVSRYRQILEKSDGYRRTDGKGYLGNPFNLFLRFRYNFGTKLSYGFTAEKDAGEEFFKGSNKQGFDFYSGHLFLRDFGVLKALAIGDFEVRLGQGLIMSSGFGVRKSPAVMNIKREAMKLRPYTSVNEFNYLRGGGFTLAKKGFEITAFGSYKQVDGNRILVEDTSLNVEEAFTSFNEAGYHRTVNEIADRNAVNVLTTGGNFSYNRRKWHVGVNGVYTNFFKTYSRTLFPYNQFDLNKNWLANVSIDYHWMIKNVHLFGEVGMSDNLGFGLVNGAIISLDQKVDLGIVHRYYSRNFQTFYSNVFAEATRPQNENGLYISFSIRPVRQVKLEGYTDLYRSDWLKFLTDAPSWGSDNLLQLTFTPNRKSEMYVRYRFELKKKNQTDNDGPVDFLVNESRQALRFNYKYKVSEVITLVNRIEWSHYKMGSLKAENGFFIAQDILFKKMGFPLSGNARIAIFRTSSYNTRIYAYENDVLYTFSIPAVYGNGIRYYLTLNADITRNIEVWFRVANTQVFDSKTFGSGLDEINRNHRTEIKAQVRFKL